MKHSTRATSWLQVVLALTLAAVLPLRAHAQDFGFEPPTDATDAALPAALRDLAERMLPAYRDDDPDRYLATVAALQLALGDAPAARDTRLMLQERQRSEQRAPAARAVVFDVYTLARAFEAAEGLPFAEAYARAFRETLASIDDLAAYRLEQSFLEPTEPARAAVQRALDAQRGKNAIALYDGLELVRAWFVFDAYRSFAGEVRSLLAEDIERRYSVEEIAIPVADAALAAALVRPRTAEAAGALPTLLELTLDRSSRDAREAAAHGYASVLAQARIAGPADSRPRAPFESDGDDARAVIDWIAAQPWSDGRVGMQGVGYGGFAAWSAAKRRPAALRAMAISDPLAPGIDIPSRGRVVQNSAYRWLYGVLAPADDAMARDDARWRAIDEDWYRAGRSYRELPTLPGRASTVFRRWLNHPSYDRFWQKWLPVGEEFAQVDIPVLTVTGYYSTGATASLYYFTEHHRHAPNAEHALLIGPFNAQSVERGASAAVRELGLEPTARIDAREVRYAWFDHALRGAERPALASAAVNYQLAGANEWRHAESLQALESQALRFYLAPPADGAMHRLAAQQPEPMSLPLAVDLRDRADADWRPSEALVRRDLEPRGSLLFATAPFDEPVALAGRISGELDFTVNRYDVDLRLMLYELTANGDYVKLFDPDYTFRLSYARDRVNRHLLTAGVRQQLPFTSEHMVGRRLGTGSRLVLELGINKRPDQQINYGDTGDVSEATIDAVSGPTRIRWHEGSFIEVASQPLAPPSAAPQRSQ